MSFQTVKAGWLHRLSSVLHRWKRNWFVLDHEGVLRVYENRESHSAEKAIRIRTECQYINTADQITDIDPPNGLSKGCLFQIVLSDKRLLLCAESPDDMSAWQLSLQDARVINTAPNPGQVQVHVGASRPPAYSGNTVTTTTVYPQQQAVYPQQQTVVYPQQQVAYGYPGQVMYGSNPPNHVVVNPSGHTTVVYTDTRRRYYRDDDFALGMMAGAMLMPVWYW